MTEANTTTPFVEKSPDVGRANPHPPADPKGPANDPVKDNMAQGLDTKKHDATDKSLVSPAFNPGTKTSADVLKEIQTILLEHDNKETDIPLTHGYWNLLNQYRRLRNQENGI